MRRILLLILGSVFVLQFASSVTAQGVYTDAIDRTTEGIINNIDPAEPIIQVSTSGAPGAEAIKSFLIKKILDILVPLVVVIGILIAILGFYKIFFSSDEKSIAEGSKLLMYGVLGIIFIVSAKFITSVLYSDIFNTGILDATNNTLKGYLIAQQLYEKIAYPFLKFIVYVVLSVLFIILTSRAFTFVFAADGEAKKKAGTIIARNLIGMFVILAGKQLVEFVYGKQKNVVKDITDLGQIGSGILENKEIPIIYQIINWAMLLASLIILIMVIVQAFQLLLNPDSPDAMKKIKKSLLYIFIGMLVLFFGYIITNFLVIN